MNNFPDVHVLIGKAAIALCGCRPRVGEHIALPAAHQVHLITCDECRAQAQRRLIGTAITTPPFYRKVVSALNRAGYLTVESAATLSDDQLREIKGMGVGAVVAFRTHSSQMLAEVAQRHSVAQAIDRLTDTLWELFAKAPEPPSPLAIKALERVYMNAQTETKPKPIDEVALPPHGGAVAIQEAPGSVAVLPQSENLRMMEMLMQAARDPAVDVVKFKELMGMREQMEDRASKVEFDIALAAAQKAMEPVRADMVNDQTKSRYPSHRALDGALRPHYSKYDLSLSFDTEPTSSHEVVRMKCYVSHAGFTKTYTLDVPADGKGAKGNDVMTKTHANSSAVTYGMKDLLRMIFNLPTDKREDDDGNAAGGGVFINEGQVDQLELLISDINAEFKKAKIDLTVNVEKICERVGATNIESIPTKKYDMLVKSLKQWAAGEMRKGKK